MVPVPPRTPPPRGLAPPRTPPLRFLAGFGVLACPAAEATVVDEEERTATEILQTGIPAEVAIAPTTQPSPDLALAVCAHA